MLICNSKIMKFPNQTLAFALCILFGGEALAVEVPNAGAALSDQPKIPSVQPHLPSPSQTPQAPPVTSEDAGPRVRVNTFAFKGASLIPESELQAQLTEYTNKEYSFKELQGIALRLIGYYADKGFLARVVLAPQNFTDGVVTFSIVEAKLGKVELNLIMESRIDTNRAKGFVTARSEPGTPLHLKAVGEAMLILNEQPGVDARTTLKSGIGEGEVDLIVDIKDKPLATITTQVNNNGSLATGEIQASAAITLSNPTGRFDSASLLLNGSDGVKYVSADYSMAVGERGLRIGGNASYLDYSATQSELNALDVHGTAKAVDIYASFPIKRQALESMSVTADINQKDLQDFVSGINTSNRTVSSASVSLMGWRINDLIGVGVTSYDLSLSVGKADLSGNGEALATDHATRHTDGDFVKISWGLGQMMDLPEKWHLAANLHGQFSDGNLDSAEQFSLGGPNGVRAYPIGEARGDEGWLLSVNFIRPINDVVTAKLFVDYGQITRNKETWSGWDALNPNLQNYYALSGIGAGLDWNIHKNINLTSTIAVPLSNNPGRDNMGNDSDGRSRSARLWVSLQGNF